MLHAGLDLSRRWLDVCLLDDGELFAKIAVPPDADGLRHSPARLGGQRVRAVIESMTGARFVHDTLEELGWDVLVEVAQKVKRARPAGLQDRQDRRPCPGRVVLARPGPGNLAGRPERSPRAPGRALQFVGHPPGPGSSRVERPDQLWHLDMTSIWVAEHGWC